MSIVYVRSSDNRADIGTKPLKRGEFERARLLLNINPVQSSDLQKSFDDFVSHKAFHMYGNVDPECNFDELCTEMAEDPFKRRDTPVCKATDFKDERCRNGGTLVEEVEMHRAEQAEGGA